MRRALTFLIIAAGLAAATAQQPAVPDAADPVLTIVFKDGRRVQSSAVRLQGGTLMSAVTDKGIKGEIGYPLDTVQKVEFPMPSQLQTAAALLAGNKPIDAIAQIEPVLKSYYPLRAIPGNWWPQLAMLRLNAMVLTGRGSDARPLITELAHSAADGETMQAIRVEEAAAWVREGSPDKAVAQLESVIRETSRPDIAARAWVETGNGLSALKRWEPALLAYLHVPVFYPGQKNLLPAALLGSARSLAGIEDVDSAKDRLQEIIDNYPASPEAVSARSELDKLNKTNPNRT